MIIVDPVQKDRNAAAVLSKENYEKFILACRKFLKKPGKDFFIKKEMTIDKLKKKTIGKKLILLDVNAFSGKRDIVGSKLLKGFEFLKKEIDKKEFNVYESGWKWDKEKKALFWFILDPKKLSEFIVWQGPPVNLREHADKFKKKYKKTFVKKGRLFAKVKRKYKNSDKLIKDLIKDKYLKDKIKKILTAV